MKTSIVWMLIGSMLYALMLGLTNRDVLVSLLIAVMAVVVMMLCSIVRK